MTNQLTNTEVKQASAPEVEDSQKTDNSPTDFAEKTEASVNTGHRHHRDPSLTRHKHKSHKKRDKRVRIVLIVLGVLIAALIGVVCAFFAVNAYMDNYIKEINNKAAVDINGSTDSGQTVSYNGHTYRLNPNMVSILVVGHDDDGDTMNSSKNEADSVAVAALDTNTGKLTVIAIPRDSYALVDQYGTDSNGNRTDYVGQSMQQLCLAYTYGTGEDAAENVKAAVQRILLNMPIAYYMDIEQSGIGEVTNSVGGVTVTALETIPGSPIVQGEQILLMGSNAERYVTYRDISKASSLDRQKRQSQFLDAFVKKVFQTANGNVGILADLFDSASEYVGSNLDTAAVIYLGSCCINNGVDMGKVVTLQGEVGSENGYTAYYLDNQYTTDVLISTYYQQID